MKITRILPFMLAAVLGANAFGSPVIWIEAEQFSDTGKWSNDSQYVDLMGSPYLLATGIGKPVADAVTNAKVPETGKYRLWVRCKDWFPSHSPGRFQVLVAGEPSSVTFGKAKDDAWQWVDGGTFDLERGDVEVRIHDLTGWWGRCDAVILAGGDFKPANDLSELATQRLKYLGVAATAKKMGPYDVVVVGGGPAGCGAAVAAARNGVTVALIQDRPVLGGNASNEIQIPPMGYIGNPPDKVNVTGLCEEFFPEQGWHNFAKSETIESVVRAEENLSLFLNTRAYDVEMKGAEIQSVLALDVCTGQRMKFLAPRFIDCTGHGWIGYYAGAYYRMGQEAREEFNESLAPVKAGKRTMGNSLYFAVIKTHPGDGSPIVAANGETIKYSDKQDITVTGNWAHSTFRGGDYLHDDNTDKGKKSVSFNLNVKKAGRYRVFLGYIAFENRAKSVPVTVVHANGIEEVTIDQTANNRGWRELGTYLLNPGKPARVTISNAGTTGVVVADCVRLLEEGQPEALSKEELERRENSLRFECPEWAYQWKSPEDFEPRGSHRRRSDIVRPENFDRPSTGQGRNPGNDPSGGILYSWWVEYGGVLDTIQDAEKIRDELFRINIGLWNYAKNHNPSTIEKNKNRELVWLNYVPGVRESRRLVGDYIMSQEDYDHRIVHNDTVAFTDWGPDVHHPEGFWVRGNDCIHVYQGRRTSIPYRSLYSQNIENLFMAGRCHSATHIAMGGTRVIRPMCATGQAAGTAAAIATKRETSPRGVYEEHIAELQQTLLRDGCYLMGVKNADENDLARSARLTASSSAEGLGPENAVNGWNRIVDGERNAWTPDANTNGPHWIQFQLDGITTISTIHVTFEERNSATDFAAEAWVDGTWKTVVEVDGNVARRRVLGIDGVKTDRIRIVVPHFLRNKGVCEVRVYAESD